MSERAWILLPSGKQLDLLNPDPWAWTDDDLAIGLSLLPMGRILGLGPAAFRRTAFAGRAGRASEPVRRASSACGRGKA